MPDVIEPLPVKSRGGNRYPWREWFGFGCFRLVKGVHYACRTDSMHQMVRNSARVHGIHVSVNVEPDEQGLVVSVLPPWVSEETPMGAKNPRVSGDRVADAMDELPEVL